MQSFKVRNKHNYKTVLVKNIDCRVYKSNHTLCIINVIIENYHIKHNNECISLEFQFYVKFFMKYFISITFIIPSKFSDEQ